LNEHLALPNKFFEFVQARLAIVVGPSPEMAKIVNQYGLGLVSNSFDAKVIANLINSMTTEVVEGMKYKSSGTAKLLSAETQAKHLNVN
jgi:hypothetical protein